MIELDSTRSGSSDVLSTARAPRQNWHPSDQVGVSIRLWPSTQRQTKQVRKSPGVHFEGICSFLINESTSIYRCITHTHHLYRCNLITGSYRCIARPSLIYRLDTIWSLAFADYNAHVYIYIYKNRIRYNCSIPYIVGVLKARQCKSICYPALWFITVRCHNWGVGTTGNLIPERLYDALER